MFNLITKIKQALTEFSEERDKDDDKWTVYVFVRKDIPIWAQVVQVGHVCFEAGRLFHDDIFKTPTLILLKVKDEHDLRWVQSTCGFQEVRTCIFYEPEEKSLGDENVPSFTALCTEPVLGDGEKWRKAFSDFELWDATIQ